MNLGDVLRGSERAQRLSGEECRNLMLRIKGSEREEVGG